jgi:nitrate reductase gamma subunit
MGGTLRGRDASMFGLRFGHIAGLLVIVAAVAMLCNPDPRYAGIPSYEESSGNAAGVMIVLGILLFFAASD